MGSMTEQNKTAWEYGAYDFWVRDMGTPAERAKEDRKNPRAMLRENARYFDRVDGLKIANICGSCGKKAVPLALMGARVTVFDISEDNRRYACETAEAAGVHMEYVLVDVLAIDLSRYGETFDLVFMEGGVLHYFEDLGAFMAVMAGLLKPGGRMICSDFHPLQKVIDVLWHRAKSMDYFSADTVEAEMPHAAFYPDEQRRQFPTCCLRRHTLSEILNAAVDSGLVIRRFDEHPAWTDKTIPGLFTLLADKS